MPISTKAHTTGAEFKEFLDSEHLKGYYLEDCAIEPYNPETGEYVLEPDRQYKLEDLGYLNPIDEVGVMVPIENEFLDWRKKRVIAIFVVQCRKDVEAAVRDAILSAGGTTIG